jgi:ABC-2 type transport system ATP-binding protein
VNGLDPQGVRWVRGLLRGLADQGRTVLVSSHLIGEVAQTADNLLVIGGGRILADTTVAEFAARGAGSLEDAYFTATGGSPEDDPMTGSTTGRITRS